MAGYLHLIARDRDADTLFFQRVLCMEGDTDLGLRVKNLLDGLDLQQVESPPGQRAAASSPSTPPG